MDWATIFIHDTTWEFATEIVVRCVCMFIMIILFLRLTGKRGVRQLSVFELAIILSLGSIAGDPMFTKDLPLIQALLIMSIIITMYRLTTWLMMKYQPFEDLLEGKPIYIVENGRLVVEEIKKGKMSHDEFFAEMRQQGIEHLGQVRTGLLETDGKFSILFFKPEDVRPGLPLFPKTCMTIQDVKPEQLYACIYCGQVQHLSHVEQICPRCTSADWTEAMNSYRVT
ncbi:DUF421 domain-containing protein [Acinetobacter bohemicus]|uniref:DUF421 domain-containing protein n=1 Tax=Acinetobacter TaxID=469 RepID=UPI00209B455B|nr:MULTISPECIES: DUF421 domain-containing protein [Acinetobacter]MCO8041537.1 DUF421 domain-containing protein [Acinetobacter sp. S4400-12]MCU7223561.1 DUF421 domain-containing protein [Acinetobacter bohemicus]